MPMIQKMVMTLLAIALVPVFLIAAMFFYYVQSLLQTRESDQLNAIASIQKGRVENLIAQNQARLAGYTGRVGLQAYVVQYNAQHGAAQVAAGAVLQQSVTSLKAGDAGIEAASLLNPAGVVIASTVGGTIGQPYARPAYLALGRSKNDVTDYIVKDTAGNLHLYLVGPLPNGAGGLAGIVVLETSMNNFAAVTSDYTGLGQSGEVMLVRRAGDGSASDILPLRFNKQAALNLEVSPLDMREPAAVALGKKEGTFANMVDYRGQKVLAATRYIAQADWGLAVMIDQSEAYQSLNELSNLLIVVVFIVSVVIIFVAFFLARFLNEPILALAATAEKIRDGDLTQRAQISTGDEIGRLAATFNAMVENVEKVDQMKSEFVLLASHQLRTPATAVKGFISMLLDGYAGKLDAQHTKLLEAAYEENERQISVINSILDVARMEAGEMVLERKDYDLGEVAEASAKAQRAVIESHHQHIVVKRPKRPVIAWVDPDRLQLVTDNLIHNASKYSGRDKTITVTVRHGSKFSTITVADQGIGIAKADFSRLFKRFSRISGPETANIPGAGLGLYLAERLIKLHGGRIMVESKVGQGTTFTVELPNTQKEVTSHGASFNR